jgi:hypothetical protein
MTGPRSLLPLAITPSWIQAAMPPAYHLVRACPCFPHSRQRQTRGAKNGPEDRSASPCPRSGTSSPAQAWACIPDPGHVLNRSSWRTPAQSPRAPLQETAATKISATVVLVDELHLVVARGQPTPGRAVTKFVMAAYIYEARAMREGSGPSAHARSSSASVFQPTYDSPRA